MMSFAPAARFEHRPIVSLYGFFHAGCVIRSQLSFFFAPAERGNVFNAMQTVSTQGVSYEANSEFKRTTPVILNSVLIVSRSSSRFIQIKQ